MLDLVQIDIYLAVWLNFLAIDIDNDFKRANTVFTFVGLLFLVFSLSSGIYLSTRINSVKDESLEPGYVRYYNSWWWMRDGMKKTSWFTAHHNALVYGKDPLITLALVFAHDTPMVQIGVFFGVNFCFFFWYIVHTPFISNIKNVIYIFNSAATTGTVGV